MNCPGSAVLPGPGQLPLARAQDPGVPQAMNETSRAARVSQPATVAVGSVLSPAIRPWVL